MTDQEFFKWFTDLIEFILPFAGAYIVIGTLLSVVIFALVIFVFLKVFSRVTRDET